MSSGLADILTSIALCSFAAAGTVLAIKLFRPSKLGAIPTVGSAGWLGPCLASLRYLTNATDVIQEGYEKHNSAPFKVAAFYHWIVVLGSRKHVEELQGVPDDTLALQGVASDEFQIKYTMGPQFCQAHHQVHIIRSRLTPKIGALYSEMRDEMITAFVDVLDLTGNEWKGIPALNSVQRIVSRTSNRTFVGLPLCRDPGWMDLSIRYSFDVAKGGGIIRLFPDLLKPIAARLFTNVNRDSECGMKLLGPIIKERQKWLDEYGNDWVDKPDDLLSWFMDEAEGSESTTESLVARILVNNFAAIPTTSNSFGHVLFYLAANSKYIEALREEVETIVEKDGWSKASLGEMRKVDSFIRECQRLEGINDVAVQRKTLKDYKFSDGTFVPRGTVIVVPIRSIHCDEAFYKSSNEFEPFRFADLPEQDGEGLKHQFTSTTSEYFSFGHGRHACPGRFFAASVMKSMLAHIVVTYDVKLVDNTARPRSLHFGTAVVPDPSAKVMFRRRVDG